MRRLKLRSLCGKFRPVPSQDEKSDREAFSKEWNSPGSPSLRPVSLQVPQVHRSHRYVPQLLQVHRFTGPTSPRSHNSHRSHGSHGLHRSHRSLSSHRSYRSHRSSGHKVTQVPETLQHILPTSSPNHHHPVCSVLKVMLCVLYSLLRPAWHWMLRQPTQ